MSTIPLLEQKNREEVALDSKNATANPKLVFWARKRWRASLECAVCYAQPNRLPRAGDLGAEQLFFIFAAGLGLALGLGDEMVLGQTLLQ